MHVDVGAACGDERAGACNAKGVCMGPRMSLGAMRENTCARVHDGSVWCWGANVNGQIGDGTTVERPNPTRVRGLPPASSVTVGYYHACAIAMDGDVYCWGRNQFGQLGNGEQGVEAVSVPQKVDGVHAPRALALGEDHTCALLENGDVVCWGSNAFAQIGAATGTAIPRPTRVDIAPADKIATAKRHTCAVLHDESTVVCWGWNLQRQLGPAAGASATSAAAVPVDLPRGVKATDVTVAHRSTCALGADQYVYCWGLNDVGQLGNGTQAGSVMVDRGDGTIQPAEPNPGVVLRRDEDGGGPLANVQQLFSTDGSHVIVRTNDRIAPFYSWGKDDRGELGRGELGTPGQVFPLAMVVKVLPLDARAIASGEDHVCAVFASPADPSSPGASPTIQCYGSSWGDGAGVVGSEDPATAQPLPAEVKWLESPP